MDDNSSAPTVASNRQSSSWRRRIAPLSLIVAAIVISADQLTKHWAVNALSGGRERHVVGSLQWNLAYNTGMAFSRGQGLGPVIALLALLVVIVLVVGTARIGSRTARIAAGLLIGGALGNLLDRVFRGRGWLHGAVIDFIDVQWWPIFNVADMAVSTGAVLFALSSLIAPRHRPPSLQPQHAEPVEPVEPAEPAEPAEPVS
jgi:signal peptidase II